MRNSPAFHTHNHADCAHDVIARAEAVTTANGTRMTPVRRRTLEILLEAHRALGAYDVLQRLAAEGYGNQPPVAYRALDFLVEQGLVHRISRLNAFTACMNPGEAHAPVFLICTQCGTVAEAPGSAVRLAMRFVATEAGFTIDGTSAEASGICPACQTASA